MISERHYPSQGWCRFLQITLILVYFSHSLTKILIFTYLCLHSGVWLKWLQLPLCMWWPSWSQSSSMLTGSFLRVGPVFPLQQSFSVRPLFLCSQSGPSLHQGCTVNAIDIKCLVRKKVSASIKLNQVPRLQPGSNCGLYCGAYNEKQMSHIL